MLKAKIFVKLFCIVICLVMVATLMGCGQQAQQPAEKQEEKQVEQKQEEKKAEEPKAEEKKEEKKKIKLAFNNYSDSHEFCNKIHKNIKENCEKYGVELVYAEASMEAQKIVNNCDMFLMQDVDAIFEFNWIPEVHQQIAPKCKDAGVQFITGDVKSPGIRYFGANNYQAGVVLGEFLAKQVKEKWDGNLDYLVLTYYVSGGEVLYQRMHGIADGFKKTYPDFPDKKILDFDNNGDILKTKSIVTDFLTAHPNDKHIVFATNNDEGGTGALSAVESAKREKDCWIISHGADTPFQENIRAGKGDIWIGSVAYTPEKYGDYLVPMVVDLVNGKDVPEDVYLEHFVVTKDNIDQYYPAK